MSDETKTIQKDVQSLRIEFTKLIEKTNENGQHFSYFNKNLEQVKNSMDELKTMLKEQDRVSAEHRKRVEPMLFLYESNVAASKVLKRWGTWLGIVAGAVTSIYVIREFIIKFLAKNI